MKTVLSAANVEERCLPIFAPSVNTSLVWIKTLITVTNAEFAGESAINNYHVKLSCLLNNYFELDRKRFLPLLVMMHCSNPHL